MAESNTWEKEIEAEMPLEEQVLHSGSWEDENEVRSKYAVDLDRKGLDKVEMLEGEAQEASTKENTGGLAVAPELVSKGLITTMDPLISHKLLQAEAEAVSNTEKLSPEEELARVAVDANQVEGRKLRSQLQVANQDLRQVQVKLTSVVGRLVTTQKGIINVKSAITKKKEELMVLELEELKLLVIQNSTLLEQNALEEERVERQTISVDTLGRLTSHLLGATMFQSGDIRAKQEILTEGRLAMQQARGEALLQEDMGELEESRKKLAKETIQREQEARNKEAKDRQNKAKQDLLNKEQAAREVKLQAEEARRAEAKKKEEEDRKAWSAGSTSSSGGLKAQPRAGSKNWPVTVGLQLVPKDEVPRNNAAYK